MMSIEKKHTVLWADDDPDDLSLMHEVLKDKDHHFNFKEVQNGLQAMSYLNSLTDPNDFPNLIILDMNMPILNGRETLVQIKSNHKFENIPIVVFTTSNSELDRSFCRHYGVEMITKPPTFNGLKLVVQKLLSYVQS